MRILCVHGFGSNANVQSLVLDYVSKVQLAPFRQELRRVIGHDAELEVTYLQGDIETQPFPGIGELFPPPYYRFWDGDSPSSVLAAIELISSSIDANKSDIVFAHSDGGAAALSALLHRAHNVKCIILVSPFPPFDASGRKRLDVSMAGPLVHIPTLLVRGESDPFAFFVAMAKGLVDEKNLTVYSWKGGHEPPNSSERGMWAQMAQDVVEILHRR